MSFGHNQRTKKRPGWNVKESVVKPDTAPQERVDLDPVAFDRLIEQKGVDLKVYRTTYCPQVKSVDGAEHEIDCTLCNGSGWVDLDPICTRAFVQSQGLDTLAHVEGFVQGNTVSITFPTGIELQYMTLVELNDFTEIYMQRIFRSANDVDVLKYHACRVNIVIDRNGVRYYQDQDFKIDINGNLDWSFGSRAPAENIPYSVHYEAAVQYRAIHAIHVNRFTQVKTEGGVEHLKMPEQWMCVKEFLIRRENQAGNELEQGPYDNHEIVED